MIKDEYRARLENFKTLDNVFDRYLFRHGHLILLCLMAVSLCAFIFSGEALFGFRHTLRWHEMIMYIYAMSALVGGIYIMRAFLDEIPISFIQLLDRGVIADIKTDSTTAQKFVSFLNDFEKKLNQKIPLLFTPIIFIVSVIFLQVSTLLVPAAGQSAHPVWITAINVFTLLIPITMIGYLIALFAWKSMVVGYYVRRFSMLFKFTLQPVHPDKAGGLRPLGDLVFLLSFFR